MAPVAQAQQPADVLVIFGITGDLGPGRAPEIMLDIEAADAPVAEHGGWHEPGMDS